MGPVFLAIQELSQVNELVDEVLQKNRTGNKFVTLTHIHTRHKYVTTLIGKITT